LPLTRQLVFLWVLLAAAVTTPRRAVGQRKHDVINASAQDEARELYKKGMTHYEIGEFDAAIDEFKHAYALTSAPGLLFNIAQVYRTKKDPEQAVYFYRTYLRLVPDASNRADVEALIAENQALADELQAKKRAEADAAASAAAAGAAAERPTPPRRRPWRVELWSGAAAAALGVGALATAVALGQRSSSDSAQISSANAQGDVPWDASKQKLYRDGQNSAIAATTLYVVGGVLAAGGAALMTVALRDRSRARSLAVAPSARGVSLVMSCAF
jgi:tetratricopeptide (TPR) repeat protein